MRAMRDISRMMIYHFTSFIAQRCYAVKIATYFLFAFVAQPHAAFIFAAPPKSGAMRAITPPRHHVRHLRERCVRKEDAAC